jgi:putative addiction module component (TIGR02574 family)
MTAKAVRMKSELAGLTPQDRAELVRFLIESLDGKEEQGVTAAWDEELKRRAEEIQSGRVTGEPAEKLLREMRARYSLCVGLPTPHFNRPKVSIFK